MKYLINFLDSPHRHKVKRHRTHSRRKKKNIDVQEEGIVLDFT